MKHIASRALVFVIAAGISTPAWTRETEKADWQSLNTLRSGEKIEVVDSSSRTQKGSFVGFSEESMSLMIDATHVDVPRFEVQRVTSLGRSRRGRNAIIGALIGAGAGVVAGIIAGQSYHEEGETGLFMLLTLPVGTAGGALIGACVPSHPEIYRAGGEAPTWPQR